MSSGKLNSCWHKLSAKMLLKILLISCAVIFVAAKATDYTKKDVLTEDGNEKEDVPAKVPLDKLTKVGLKTDGDDVDENIEDEAKTMDYKKKDILLSTEEMIEVDGKEKENDEETLRSKLEEETETQYKTLVEDYKRLGSFPRTKTCSRNGFQLASLKINGCRNNGNQCYIKKGVPLTMTAAFDIDRSIKDLDISRIGFNVHGKIGPFWLNSPFYTKKNYCEDESLKSLNCIWRKNKLILKLEMKPVPTYIPLKTAVTRVQTTYKGTALHCFMVNINLE